MKENAPLVSVCCITYNHEYYIRECIEGFLMQDTSFPFEVLIHDDASTDGTADIIKEYEKKHPELIFPIYQKENQYSKKQGSIFARFVFPRARGKYIALCEGDDYWTDPMKLQKQVDFLEGNEEYVICGHKIKILEKDGKLIGDFITSPPGETTNIFDLANKGNYLHTPSLMFRNIIKQFPDQMNQAPNGDFFLTMILAQYGKIKIIDEVMGVYRHEVGIWSQKTKFERHLSTAVCHAFLIDYFSANNKPEISLIFKERIKIFLRDFQSFVRLEDFLKLAINEELSFLLFDSLIKQNSDLQNFNFENQSTKNLIKTVGKRIKNRLWKKRNR